MQTRVAQSAEHTNQQTQSPQRSTQLSVEPQAAFADNSPQATQLKSLNALMSNSPQQHQRQALQAKINGSAHARQMHTLQAHMASGTVAQRMDDDEPLQGKFEGDAAQRATTAPAAITAQSAPTAEAPKPNNTGLSNQLKAGIESLSGMSMDHVKVHYNSSKPAQLQAHAYAQGSEIHVAPGQEQHLPHEAWHVVQQAQGRVKPTMQMKSGVPVNDDAGLEQEADVMGARALQRSAAQFTAATVPTALGGNVPVQRMIDVSKLSLEEFTQINEIEPLREFIRYGMLAGSFVFINNRAQTFKQAVGEFIKTRSLRSDEVAQKWEGLLTNGNVGVVKARMLEIAEIINQVKAEKPDHPNAAWSQDGLERGDAVAHESPGTIPQTVESRLISNAIWDALEHNSGELRAAMLEGQVGANGEQKKNFMIGVLVYPSRQVIVGVSGSLNRIGMFADLCKDIVEKRGCTLKAVVDRRSLPSASVESYDLNFAEVRGKPAKKFDKEKDIGNKPGTCAAAVILGSDRIADPEPFAEREEGSKGKVLLGLTEVFTGRTALISNRLEPEVAPQRWPKNDDSREYDVPSCETCQHQLDLFALNLVILDRQMRVKAQYPQQIDKLKQQLAHLGEDLAAQVENIALFEKSLDSKKEHLAHMRTEEKALRARREDEYMLPLGECNKLNSQKEKLEKAQTISKGTDERLAALIAEYRNRSGRAPGMVWTDIEKAIPSLKGTNVSDRKQKLSEWEQSQASSSSSDGSSEQIQELQSKIEKLEESMRTFSLQEDEFAQRLEALKKEVKDGDKELLQLKKKIEQSESNFAETKEKLARYPKKLERERAALENLEEKRHALAHHGH
jgi:uncharacterized coiled-coil DUF342 family protein